MVSPLGLVQDNKIEIESTTKNQLVIEPAIFLSLRGEREREREKEGERAGRTSYGSWELNEK